MEKQVKDKTLSLAILDMKKALFLGLRSSLSKVSKKLIHTPL